MLVHLQSQINTTISKTGKSHLPKCRLVTLQSFVQASADLFKTWQFQQCLWLISAQLLQNTSYPTWKAIIYYRSSFSNSNELCLKQLRLPRPLPPSRTRSYSLLRSLVASASSIVLCKYVNIIYVELFSDPCLMQEAYAN